MDPRGRAVVAAAADLALVAVFVAVGRMSHREDQQPFVTTFWPFAAGLAAGWLAARGWRHPFSILRTGVPAWIGTVLVGMLLRAASGQGVQPAFVVVATIVVGAALLGWRAVLAASARSATRGREAPGAFDYFFRRR